MKTFRVKTIDGFKVYIVAERINSFFIDTTYGEQNKPSIFINLIGSKYPIITYPYDSIEDAEQDVEGIMEMLEMLDKTEK